MSGLYAHALPLLVAVPLGGALLAALAGRSRRWGTVAAAVALVASAAVLLIAGRELRELLTGFGGAGAHSSVYPVAGVFEAGLGVRLYADPLATIMLAVVAAAGFAVVVYSLDVRRRGYHALVLLMIAGMNGVVVAGDLFSMFVFIEVASIAGCALVALGPAGPTLSPIPSMTAMGPRDGLAASFRCLVTGAVASGLVLFAIVLVYARHGTLDMALLAGKVCPEGERLGALAVVVGALFVVGLGMKAGLVPFGGWLADASEAAPAPVGALLSGAATKVLGVYALARVLFGVLGAGHFGQLMIALGLVTAVAGPLAAMGQSNIKKVFACHAIGGTGMVMVGLGLGACLVSASGGGGGGATEGRAGVLADAGRLALVGAAFGLVNQAALGVLFFLCAGSVERSAGSSRLDDIGGVGQAMPVTGLALVVGALSASGVPPLGGFWSVLMIVMAAALGRMYVLAGAVVLASFLVLVSLARLQGRLVFGRVSERTAAAGEAPPRMALAVMLMAVVTIGLGVFFSAVATRLAGPVADVLASGTGYGETVRGLLETAAPIIMRGGGGG